MDSRILLIDVAMLALLAAAWLYFLRAVVRRAAHLPSRKLHITPELWVAVALTVIALVYYLFTLVRPGRP